MNHRQDVLHVEEIQSVINETHQGDRDQEILDSWRRCVNVHALNPIEKRSAYILPEEHLREHVDEAEDLLRTASSAWKLSIRKLLDTIMWCC